MGKVAAEGRKEGIGPAGAESSHTSQHMESHLAAEETKPDSVASEMDLKTEHSWDVPEELPQ